MPTDFKKVDRLVSQAVTVGLNRLGNDVKKRAVILAPVDTGALRQSSKVKVKGDSSVIVSFNTPYAKLRHYQNNLHPSTRYYLNNALKSITNLGKYFRGGF